MGLPPQETTIKRTAAIAGKNNALWVADLRTNDPLMNALRIEDMRIDTSKSTAEKGKKIAQFNGTPIRRRKEPCRGKDSFLRLISESL
jgi:hypothetical protein